MKYLYIELNGFKRFRLNNIEHFSMTLTDPLQLILGSNGSGKSSLVGEMTPLPAFHGDFTKQGSKVIKIEHHHEVYTLKSSFFPSQKHSFLKGDQELNDGGTVTVQKELVKTHFGITPEIHRLIMGAETFEAMSAAKRKEWFIKLCVTNYDYAIKAYNKFKEKHRDATGALRLAKKRLVLESEKLIQSDEETRLRTETQVLHDHLSHLLEYRKPVEKDLDTLQVQQSQIDEMLMRLAKSLNQLTEAHNDSAQLSVEMLEHRIAQAEESCFKAKALIEQFSADYSRNQEKINILQRAEQQTISSLQQEIDTLDHKLTTTQSRLLVTGITQASVAMTAFQTIKVTLSEIFTTIPANRDKQYSQESLLKHRETLALVQGKKRVLIEDLQAKQNKLKHMQTHKDKPDLQCPSCHHKFSLNYNDQEYHTLITHIATLEKVLEEKIAPAIIENEAFIEQCLQYAQLYRQYTTCVNNWPVLSPYWDYLADKRIVLDHPQSGINALMEIDVDLSLQMDAQFQLTALTEKKALLTLLKDVGGVDLNTLLNSNQALSALIETHTEQLQSSSQARKLALEAKQRIADIASVSSKITGYIQKKRGLNKEEIETLRRLELNGAIRTLQSALAAREHTLVSLNLQRGVVDNIALQISDMEQDEAALAVLVKQLSPTEGLIAEGLLGFIKNYVNEMNALIKKVWAYPLVIQTCEILDDNSVDLDYLFPMLVSDSSEPVSDVCKGSAAMKEIVNMAFRLIAMRYLNLQDAPLVLDEFGAAMDVVHKKSTVYLIKALIEQQTFSQVFMISHDFAQYGALTSMQTCVLCSNNIVAPKESNRHVTLR